jgi:ferredoxin
MNNCPGGRLRLPFAKKRLDAGQPWQYLQNMAISLKVNGQQHSVDVDPTTPLLYVLSDDLGLNGPKFGCGLGQCGACTVIVKGQAIRSCLTPVKTVEGSEITTLEGLRTAGSTRCRKRLSKSRPPSAVLRERRHHDSQGFSGQEWKANEREIQQAMSVYFRAASRMCGCCRLSIVRDKEWANEEAVESHSQHSYR